MANDLIPANLSCRQPIQSSLALPFESNQTKQIRYALTNNFAFGGVNCSLALENLAL
jgi:3-oxoacyl-(acyl-carrier-protein) synthase